jgi:ABC-type lipoprotein export system ATPase subunit
MKVSIQHRCSNFASYRAARVKSLFNVESGCNVHIEAELPLNEQPWQVGVIVGPSGSGKTSIGQAIGPLYAPRWPVSRPIIDAIAPRGSFDAVTAALSAVGLGTVPTWLRPYAVLSNGEQFRANLARLVCDAPKLTVVDEFSSVVDRQIARIGAGAFAKAWRRTTGKVVLLSCHYDILDWLQPDWIYDTASGQFEWGWHRPRPRIELEIREAKLRDYAFFEPHHYLKLPPMIASTPYVAWVGNEPVAHVAFSTRPGLVEARACRLVVMPEWQGAGVGMHFLNALCERWLQGHNRYGLRLRTLFHTSHPGLAAALRRDPHWTQVSGELIGGNKGRSQLSIINSNRKLGRPTSGTGFGGHFRAVQGFRYLGSAICES